MINNYSSQTNISLFTIYTDYYHVKDNFLIATENMNDNKFKKTVVIMLESDEKGAWGLVINKPIGSLPLALLIDPSLNTS